MKHLFKYSFTIVLFFLFFKTNAQSIIIKPQNLIGTIPTVYKPGMYYIVHNTNANDDFLNNTIQYNTLRLNTLVDALNWAGVTSISDVLLVLEYLKPSLLTVNARCNKLILPIMKMPAWLSSSSDNTVVESDWSNLNSFPPANYAVWDLLMDSIVNKINVQWGLDPYYEIWNEPENFYWQGTPSQYFEFFKHTYFALKTNHPSAKVGGPVLASFSSKFGSAYPSGFLSNSQLDSSIIGRLIDSCMVWNVHLDFISWHQFMPILHSMKMEFDYLNYKLISSGHGIVPYIISEWNINSTLRESPFASAFMINHVLALEKYGVSGQSVALWQDWQTDTLGDEFHNDYGMLSWAGLYKPAWKSLLLLNYLSGIKIENESSDFTSLSFVSTIKNDTVKVLISNYSLPGYTQATSYLLYNKHYNATYISNAGYTAYKLDSIYKGLITLTGTDSLSLAINSAIPIYQQADSAFNFGRNINLTISGVTGSHIGAKYLVDSTNNNVIYLYDSLITAGYTRATATAFLYPNSAFSGDIINLTDSVFTFHMQPNAVALFEFYVPDIIGISNNSQNPNKFEIYPNPSSESLTVIFTDKFMLNRQLQIYNSMGGLVKCVDTKQLSLVIDLSELANGLYFIQLKNQQHQTFKFVKH